MATKNIRALIHALGGQAEVRRLLENAGHYITLSGIEKMCVRNSLSSKWVIRLQRLADTEKIKLTVTDYLHNEEQADV
jgi:hypothetical protein